MKFRTILCAVCGLILSASFWACSSGPSTNPTLSEAQSVIDRFTGGQMKVRLELSLQKDAEGHDSYAYSMKDGVLTVKGSSGVALCRGFYAYVKSVGAGISSWSGNRFELPENLPDTEGGQTTSPYRDHYYLNVVTYGYTMPYWDEQRWDEEIDWMALHGIDMPLVLVAQEAVNRMVFKDMGLTDEEIDEWETGPAHLPWMRMGNIAGNTFDGPLPEAWNNSQISLLKHILKRMNALGMKPIFPAFGGFVPKAFATHYNLDITTTGWDWVAGDLGNYRLLPDNPYFVEIGRRFIQKWESLFGKGQYYLSDSFNEMKVPEEKDLLTQYGDSIYKSIASANPDATWVMQGWTVGYQRGEWSDGRLESLISHVPDNKFMLLDMATDYNKYIWHSSYDWDFYPKFYNKEWVWSVIPNMGGKTTLTGDLEFYANGRLEALKSANRGNLTGYGFAPEGVENNEIIYELLSDGGWTTEPIAVTDWLKNYATCRYGQPVPAVLDYWKALQTNVYGTFTDHPRYGWQYAPYTGKGTVNQTPEFYEAVEKLLGNDFSQAPQLLTDDLIEAAVMYACGRAEEVCIDLQENLNKGNKADAEKKLNRLEQLLTAADRALEAHPLYRLSLWEEHAQKMAGTDKELQQKYARNARRLVSTWISPHSTGEPVNDYASRIWSGMIRGYYLPRILMHFNNQLTDQPQVISDFENSWVDSAPTLTPVKPFKSQQELLEFLQEMIKI